MSGPLLLLHERHTPDDGDIWREAVRRKWTTERVNRYSVAARLRDHSPVRYYGNTLHIGMIKDLLPITFHEIPPTVLPDLAGITRRKIALLRYADLPQPIVTRQFIKPIYEKWFEAKVYETGERIEGGPLSTDLIYTSEIVEFLDEVRCFVVAGQVLTSSLYRVNKVVWDQSGVPEDQLRFDDHLAETRIPEMVAGIYRDHPEMPPAVVADFGRHADGSWSLIEFNEPYASGLYWCDVARCFDCIIASQSDNPKT